MVTNDKTFECEAQSESLIENALAEFCDLSLLLRQEETVAAAYCKEKGYSQTTVNNRAVVKGKPETVLPQCASLLDPNNLTTTSTTGLADH